MSAGRRMVAPMTGPLHPDVRLGVQLSAIMCRNRYTHDPAPVIAELYEAAGDRLDILTAEVGRWIGFYEDDYTRDLATALRALPLDMDDAIALGVQRRNTGTHTTTGFNGPHGNGLDA